jgi:hypothetical protein
MKEERIRGLGCTTKEEWLAQQANRAQTKWAVFSARKEFLKKNLPNTGNKFAKAWISELKKEEEKAKQQYLRAMEGISNYLAAIPNEEDRKKAYLQLFWD